MIKHLDQGLMKEFNWAYGSIELSLWYHSEGRAAGGLSSTHILIHKKEAETAETESIFEWCESFCIIIIIFLIKFWSCNVFWLLLSLSSQILFPDPLPLCYCSLSKTKNKKQQNTHENENQNKQKTLRQKYATTKQNKWNKKFTK